MNIQYFAKKLGMGDVIQESTIEIDQVLLNEENLSLKIFCSQVEREEDLKLFQKALGERFPDFNISWIKKDLDLEPANLSGKDYFLAALKDCQPTCISWLREDQLVEEEGALLLTLEDQVLLKSLEKDPNLLKIKDHLQATYGLNLKLLCREEDSNVKTYVDQLKEEESKIAKDTQDQCPLPEKQPIAQRKEGAYKYGKKKSYPLLSFQEVDIYSPGFYLQGEVFEVDCIEYSRQGKKNYIVKFSITDKKTSLTAKTFFRDEDKKEDFLSNVKPGVTVLLAGKMEMDPYDKGLVIKLEALEIQEKIVRKDEAEEKRVEFHTHTKMSSMDGMVTAGDLIQQASAWGHPAIAITDHAVVQSYPEAMAASKKHDIQVVYGMEANFIQDQVPLLENLQEDTKDVFVVFDVETTGFSPVHDRITEIGAVKIEDGRITDRYSQLINPLKRIPDRVVELTSITNDMVADKPSFDQVAQDFFAFTKGAVLVAHNAKFDMAFMRESFKRIGIDFNRAYMDTLVLAKNYIVASKNYKLGTLCKKMGISLLGAHRAVNDAEATAKLFLKLLASAKKEGLETLKDFQKARSHQDFKKERPSHLIILAQNLKGLKNLYHLVSNSHIENFYREPKLLSSQLSRYREGLLLGSACQKSDFFQDILRGEDFETLCQKAKFYDYLEVQPPDQYRALMKEGMVESIEEVHQIISLIIKIGKEIGRPVLATGDVHYLEPEDDIFRRILMAGTHKGKRPSQIPVESLHFRTTSEMLEDFSFLGPDLAREIVVENPRKFLEKIEPLDPIPSGKFPPHIDGAEEKLKAMSYENAHKRYGNPLPKLIEDRLKKELDSIISNGYAVMYMIAHELVHKSNMDGYYVGSRGSVGSSFVATMSGITEVNPLPPHYVCPKCQYTEFSKDPSIGSGVDLPDKVCPHCQTKMEKDGHEIPFEVFLGFYGDKEPDIDLNFAGEYQPVAHKFVEDLFGEGYVFRAGTIGTLADKTAYGFVQHFIEDREEQTPRAEINRLVNGCVGVKRTSGQHPGGIMICPKTKDIHDFTPIQYPANDKSSGRITTHFEYHAISENILKLDILGHDTPTIIRMLEDYTGFDSSKIPLDDPKTLSLFLSTEALNADPKIFTCPTGTLGIPEFGTDFVRQMLVDTKPKTFSELVRISGLSHGTDVWIGNAQTLVEKKEASLSEVISTREDIMVYLMNAGADNKMASDVMEKVRKGKGIPDKYYEKMLKLPLPKWYIAACEKIKYMFPKAHAVAYVMMSFRIAYYKVNFPEAFYASYFSQKVQDFNAEACLLGLDGVQGRLRELEEKKKLEGLTTKEKSEQTILDVALEMLSRGYKFYLVDLYESDANNFKIKEGGILLPLQSLQGLGQSLAEKIVEERAKGDFISVEDFVERTKASKTVVELLKEKRILGQMPDSNQLSLFNL